MNDLRIGKVGRRWFKLPAELAVETTAVVGRRGQGKTSTGVVIVEELAASGVQIVWIDPTDVAYGIKSSLDGKSPGLEFLVLGGPHADLPLEATGGRVIADFVVDNRVSTVLSLRHLRKKGQRQLVTEFAEQLYHRKGEAEHRTPLLVVIDEASAFVPQRVMGDSARMVGAIEDLVRRGRAAGIGVLLIDQRPASVNKDVLTQLSTLVCHQITAPQDRKALDEWIRQHDTEDRREEFNAKLASLQRGEAWFWAPGLDVFEHVQVRQRRTFDSSKTPSMGEEAAAPETVAELDLEALREQLAATIEQAEANDPKALKRELAAARAEIRRLEAAVEDATSGISETEHEAALDQTYSRGRAEGVLELAEIIGREHEKVADTLVRNVEAAQKYLDGEGGGATSRKGKATRGRASEPRKPREHQEGVARRASTPAPTKPDASRSARNHPDVSRPQQKILDTLAQLEQMGIDVMERTALAAFVGVSSKSSAYANNLGHLHNQLSLISYPNGGTVALTDEGRQHAEPPSSATTLLDLHDGFRKHLSGPQRRIFDTLIVRYPGDIDRDELADLVEASPKSSAYANNLGRMRTLGIIDYPEPGRVVATELLFPEGLH